MLNLTCFLIPVWVAVFEAKHAKAGFFAYAVAIAIGLALGLACAWLMWTVGERVGADIKRRPESMHERYFGFLYAGAVAWLLIVAFLTNVMISAAIRLFV